jgi:hypothetical protein
MSSGSDTITSTADAFQPWAGMANASITPNGSSTASTASE